MGNTRGVVKVLFRFRILVIPCFILVKMKRFFCFQFVVYGMGRMYGGIMNGGVDERLVAGLAEGFEAIQMANRALRNTKSCDDLDNAKQCEDRCGNDGQDCILACEDQEKL